MCDLSKNPDGKARPWKGVPVDKLVGHAKFLGNPSHLVLKKLPERLYEIKLHDIWKAPHIVVAFYGGRRPFEGDALDHVRIQGPLGKKVNMACL